MSVSQTDLRCTQCGGQLSPQDGRLFFACPYCGATIYADPSRIVYHWALAATLDETQARAVLANWMSGNDTVKDLDTKAQIEASAFHYFPLWYIKTRGTSGEEQIFVEPAAATTSSELKQLRLHAGELRPYDPQLDTLAQAPTVPLQTALGWLARHQPHAQHVAESALVHVPLYEFKYRYDERLYRAWVEAATGRVLVDLFPAKAERPYLLVTLGAALAFGLIALIPLALAWTRDQRIIAAGWAFCAVLAALVGIVIFAWAARVAANV